MKPYVLLTNDDGIAAPGLFALYKEIAKVADVVVVAPDKERSAAGHSITIANPLRVTDFEKNGSFFGHAVSGTPADCVKIAYYAILDRKPDAVISGINFGSNTGINIIYSGTVSAATEATFLEIPAFAISLTTYTNPFFDAAAEFARKFLPRILKNDLPPGTLLNVNVPNVPKDKIKGTKITKHGNAIWIDRYDKRSDPRNHTYYWLTGTRADIDKSIEVDDGAIDKNYISITPIQFDLTNYAAMETMKNWQIDF